MISVLELAERIARRAHQHQEPTRLPADGDHPFDVRNIISDLPSEVRRLFDNGHYAQATFEAFKYLERVVQSHARLKKSGWNLMMEAFNEESPLIPLNSLADLSERDEQQGYKFLFAGGMMGIRNPRAHDPTINDDPDTCLDHLSFVSMLLRRMIEAGHNPTPVVRKQRARVRRK